MRQLVGMQQAAVVVFGVELAGHIRGQQLTMIPRNEVDLPARAYVGEAGSGDGTMLSFDQSRGWPRARRGLKPPRVSILSPSTAGNVGPDGPSRSGPRDTIRFTLARHRHHVDEGTPRRGSGDRPGDCSALPRDWLLPERSRDRALAPPLRQVHGQGKRSRPRDASHAQLLAARG